MIWIINTSPFRLCFLTLILFFTPSLWVSAASSTEYDSYAPTLYVGSRLGYTYKHNACVDIAIECDRSDSGYGIFVGYKPGNRFSFELSASDLGDTKAIYPNVTLHGQLKTIDISAIYTRHLYKNIDVFGKVGVAYWDGEITGWELPLEDSGDRPIIAAGIQFPLSKRIDGRVEYQYLDQLGNHWMGYTDAHFLSVSFVWKFSFSKKRSSVSVQKSSEKTPQKSSPQESIHRNLFSTR